MGESAPIKSAKRDSLTVAAIKLKLLLKKYIRNTSNRRHSVEFDFIITAEDNTVSLFHLYLQCHRLENRMQSCKVPSERESARGALFRHHERVVLTHPLNSRAHKIQCTPDSQSSTAAFIYDLFLLFTGACC